MTDRGESRYDLRQLRMADDGLSIRATPQRRREATVQLTLRSNNAMRLMMYCAINDGRLAPVGEIARACNMSESHLGKIANVLAADGFVETVRGRGGGVRLARPPSEINIGAVVRRTEIGACFLECLDPKTNTCPLVEACRFRTIVGHALSAFLAVLDGYTLADLVAEPEGLRAALGLGEDREARAVA
jgi:Rrf2 family nitric oxide-sensitive transcriptional repressor